MYVVFVKRDGPAIQATALFPSDPNLNRQRNPHPAFSAALD
jgi:hypothetical protein